MVGQRRGFPNRRTWAAISLAALGLACADSPAQPGPSGSPRLDARPGPPSSALPPGTHPLNLGSSRDGVLHVPAAGDGSAPVPLIVSLHGAGGDADDWNAFADLAGSHGIALLAVDSRGPRWDGIRGEFGPDIEFLDQALAFTFDRLPVDGERIAIAGFSDGASYALTVGLANGDFVTHVVAFSPGFYARVEPRGTPEVFVSHGSADAVLPFSGTSGQIVPRLQGDGYSVTFEPFEGGHEVPRSVAERALDWLGG